MAYLDLITSIHSSTKRDYLARVNDPDFPKYKAAELAKKWGYDYWDGDRRINYGGYKYIEGRWNEVISRMIDYYGVKPGDRVLDVGCGKGFMLYDWSLILPGVEVYGIDVSEYAIANAKPEIIDRLKLGSATKLPWPDGFFKLAYSINTLHNLHCYDLEMALKEFQRVADFKYLCVESYRNEVEKANLLYWQVTCEAFNTPQEWEWWFNKTGYTGDYSYIFFD